jgi:hypothetical protein
MDPDQPIIIGHVPAAVQVISVLEIWAFGSDKKDPAMPLFSLRGPEHLGDLSLSNNERKKDYSHTRFARDTGITEKSFLIMDSNSFSRVPWFLCGLSDSV